MADPTTGRGELDADRFDLPDWGEAGAPPAPRIEEDEPFHPAVTGEQEEGAVLSPEPLAGDVALSTTTLEDGASVAVGIGESEVADGTLAEAAASATAAALEALRSRAREMGATAVVGIRVTTLRRGPDVAIVAYGTAVRR